MCAVRVRVRVRLFVSGNVAAILELDEALSHNFKVRERRAGVGGGGGVDAAGAQVFEAAPQEVRAVPAKRAAPDYFL